MFHCRKNVLWKYERFLTSDTGDSTMKKAEKLPREERKQITPITLFQGISKLSFAQFQCKGDSWKKSLPWKKWSKNTRDKLGRKQKENLIFPVICDGQTPVLPASFLGHHLHPLAPVPGQRRDHAGWLAQAGLDCSQTQVHGVGWAQLAGKAVIAVTLLMMLTPLLVGLRLEMVMLTPVRVSLTLVTFVLAGLGHKDHRDHHGHSSSFKTESEISI